MRRVEEWKGGRLEGWKDGRVGRMEGWKSGRVGMVEGWKKQTRIDISTRDAKGV